MVLATSGCDKVPLLAPTGTTITLGTSNTIVQANGTAQVTATMLESSGTPVQNGTTVTFSTNLGRIAPQDARTVNGVATAQFQATGSSGVAEIRAASGGAKPADTANPTLKITVGAAAAGRISVSATPNTVPLTGGTSTISATVTDTAGSALRDLAVTFTTTAGTLTTAVATTDASGIATTTLTTNREATVTASAGAGATAGTNTGTVVVKVNTVGTVAVTATPSPGVVGLPTSISVTLTASATGSPFQRTVIDFGDGVSRTEGGTSTTVPHTYTRAGTYVIRATAFDQLGDSTSSTVSLIVASAPRPTVSISATGNPTAGQVTTFNVNVTAAAGGAAIEDVSVNFGDGSPVVGLGASTGNQQVPHTYQTAGEYRATVDAKDVNGATGSASTLITVQAFTVALAYTKNIPTFTATFTATVNPPGTSISTYFWDFGDGSTQPTFNNSVSHTYPSVPATYTVIVTATTPNGRTASATTTVTFP